MDQVVLHIFKNVHFLVEYLLKKIKENVKA